MDGEVRTVSLLFQTLLRVPGLILSHTLGCFNDVFGRELLLYIGVDFEGIWPHLLQLLLRQGQQTA